MKACLIFLIAHIFAGIDARKLPQLSISIKNGKFSGLNCFDPTVSWSSTCDAGLLRFNYGIDDAISEDISKFPKKLWSVCRSTVRGWGLAAKTTIVEGAFMKPNIKIDLESSDQDASFQFDAGYNEGLILDMVQARKTFTLEGTSTTIMVNPRYDFKSKIANLIFNCDFDRLDVKIQASKNFQSITTTTCLDEDNKLSQSVTSQGDWTFAWEHFLGGGDSITSTYKPSESVQIAWRDKGWLTMIHMDVNEDGLSGPDISFKKNVMF